MPYMVTFRDGAILQQNPAKTAVEALRIGEAAEAQGAQDVLVEKLGAEEALPLDQFAIRYCSRNKRFGPIN